jgi:glycosyltransferase involved in cell wall biosynthesis
MNSLVSICIPAYKQPELLEKCLHSIVKQSYKQVEVLVSDDTPDKAVKIIVDKFAHQLNISYQKNETPLGSPGNWNAALDKAKGGYVMLMHHDDAFTSEHSLEKFIQPFSSNPTPDFVFGRNLSIERLSNGRPFNSAYFLKYYKHPLILLTGNFIGAPSNVMLRSTSVELYNSRYKWIVDIEFYIRLFQKGKRLYYIDETLVEIGIHEDQISNECVNNDEILLFENIFYAAENNLKIKSIKVYDFYWRLIRNAKISSLTQVTAFGLQAEMIPSFIKHIIAFQNNLPTTFLNIGITSKAFMTLGYIRNLVS